MMSALAYCLALHEIPTQLTDAAQLLASSLTFDVSAVFGLTKPCKELLLTSTLPENAHFSKNVGEVLDPVMDLISAPSICAAGIMFAGKLWSANTC